MNKKNHNSVRKKGKRINTSLILTAIVLTESIYNKDL